MVMQKQKEQILTEDPRKLLFKFSLPSIVGMVIVALYNFVDTIFVGNAVGPDAIAGLTIVLPIMIFMIAVGLLAGVGAASIVSRALGRDDRKTAVAAGGNSIIINLSLNIVLIILIYIFRADILTFLGASEMVLPYAMEYLEIIVFGFIFFTFSINCNHLIRAEGKPRASMYALLIGSCLNMALDPVFIFGLNMGVRGAAIATVISQVVSSVYILGYFMSGRSLFHFKSQMFKLKKAISREIITVGSPSFFMEAIGSIMFLLFLRVVAKYGGDLYIAITGIGIRIIDLIFMPILGISQGFSPIVSFNYGAKAYSRVKKILKETFLWTTIITSVGFIAMVIFPEFLINIFSNDPDLIEKGVGPLRIIAMLAPLWGFPILGGAFFQAIGKPAPAMLIILSRDVLFFVPAILVLPIFFDLLGVWLSWPATDIFSVLITSIFLLREIKVINKTMAKEKSLLGKA